VKVVKVKGEYGYQRLLGGEPDTNGMKSGHLRLKAGESVGEHSTGDREEAIVVLKGQAQVFCKGEDVGAVEAGSLIYFPHNTAHDIKNSGQEDLCYVYVVSPVAKI
jgi:mannose-6-phosphate isomerase-like protein (cupin superfamily)